MERSLIMIRLVMDMSTVFGAKADTRAAIDAANQLLWPVDDKLSPAR
jgi:hypothetical protein